MAVQERIVGLHFSGLDRAKKLGLNAERGTANGGVAKA
jgi:hypothetical protein